MCDYKPTKYSERLNMVLSECVVKYLKRRQEEKEDLVCFLAVQDSSIGDIVSQ